MEFKVDLYKFDISENKFLSDVISVIFKFLFIIVASPFFLISWVFKKLKQDKKNEKPIEWLSFSQSDNLKIDRRFIKDEEIPMDLDYPDEPNDIHVFKLQSNPEIIEFHDLYFDYNSIETTNGLYLISINKKGHGMTLWCLDKSNCKLLKIQDIENLWWTLDEEDEKTLRLRGSNAVNGFDIFVTEKNGL